MRKLKLALAVSSCFSLFSIAAYAAFEVSAEDENVIKVNNMPSAVTAPAPAAAQPTPTKVAAPLPASEKPKMYVGGLNHSGKKPINIKGAQGFGREVTLRDALNQIVPQDFQLFNDKNISLDNIVNWQASSGKDWSYVLDDVLRQSSVTGNLDWERKTISLDKQTGDTVIEKKPVMPTWKVKTTDKSIRHSIIRWGKESGYNVDWDVSVDFPVIAETTFTGSFESAVAQVMDSLANSDFPLQACGYDNKTIRVIRYGEANRCFK